MLVFGNCVNWATAHLHRCRSLHPPLPLDDSVPYFQVRVSPIDYRYDNRRFRLSAHNCQVSTPTSQNLALEQQIRFFGAD